MDLGNTKIKWPWVVGLKTWDGSILLMKPEKIRKGMINEKKWHWVGRKLGRE